MFFSLDVFFLPRTHSDTRDRKDTLTTVGSGQAWWWFRGSLRCILDEDDGLHTLTCWSVFLEYHKVSWTPGFSIGKLDYGFWIEGKGILDSRKGNTGFWIQEKGKTGFWIQGNQDLGFLNQDLGFWIQGTGFWIQGTGFWIQGIGFWIEGNLDWDWDSGMVDLDTRLQWRIGCEFDANSEMESSH